MIANISTALNQVGASLNRIGTQFNQASQQMIGAFAGFDQAMANTRSIAVGTSQEFEEMRMMAEQMSTEMPSSAEEIANGYYQLASAGYEANQIMALTPQILKLATATASDFETTAKVVTASLDVWGTEMYDVNEVSEILMNTVKGFKTTLPELAETMKYASTSSATLGVSMEELA